MKKIIIAALVCAASVTVVKAQTEKGNLFMGSTIGYTEYSSQNQNLAYPDGNFENTNTKFSGILLQPEFGVFVSDHLVFGGNLNLDYRHFNRILNKTETSTVNSSTITNTTTVTIGPFLRYYFFGSQPASTLFYIQAGANAGTGGGNTSGTGSNPSVNYTVSGTVNQMFVWGGAGSIGVTHFISKDIGLDIALGYLYDHEKSNNVNTTDNTATSGSKSTSSNNYELASHTNGVTLSAGFHWFLTSAKKHS